MATGSIPSSAVIWAEAIGWVTYGSPVARSWPSWALDREVERGTDRGQVGLGIVPRDGLEELRSEGDEIGILRPNCGRRWGPARAGRLRDTLGTGRARRPCAVGCAVSCVAGPCSKDSSGFGNPRPNVRDPLAANQRSRDARSSRPGQLQAGRADGYARELERDRRVGLNETNAPDARCDDQGARPPGPAAFRPARSRRDAP